MNGQVLSHIQAQIRKGGLRPGDRLPTERELATELGVSRPTVRSALKSLEAMGVVYARRGAGTFIQGGPPSLGSEPLRLLAALHDFSAEEMFEARGALEVVAAGLAAQRSTSDHRLAMAEAVGRMYASLDDPQGFLVQDIAFHRAVAAGSTNPVLATLVDMIADLVFQRRRVTIAGASDLRESADMHQKVYEAISRRNVAGARAAMAEHLKLALEGWTSEARRPTKPKTPPVRRTKE